jgi:cytochrome c553
MSFQIASFKSVLGLGLVLATALGSTTASADAAASYAAMCSSCHGAAGAGDGVAATALPVKPANFADAAFWAGKTDADVKKAIKDGGPAVGKSPMMAPFGAALDDAALDAMVVYLKTFKK